MSSVLCLKHRMCSRRISLYCLCFTVVHLTWLFLPVRRCLVSHIFKKMYHGTFSVKYYKALNSHDKWVGINIQCLTINFYFTNTTDSCAVFTNVHYYCSSSVFSEVWSPRVVAVVAAWLLLVQCYNSDITTNAEITQVLGNKSFEPASRLLGTKYTLLAWTSKTEEEENQGQLLWFYNSSNLYSIELHSFLRSTNWPEKLICHRIFKIIFSCWHERCSLFCLPFALLCFFVFLFFVSVSSSHLPTFSIIYSG